LPAHRQASQISCKSLVDFRHFHIEFRHFHIQALHRETLPSTWALNYRLILTFGLKLSAVARDARYVSPAASDAEMFGNRLGFLQTKLDVSPVRGQIDPSVSPHRLPGVPKASQVLHGIARQLIF
jgi:hypothetical protein